MALGCYGTVARPRCARGHSGLRPLDDLLGGTGAREGVDLADDRRTRDVDLGQPVTDDVEAIGAGIGPYTVNSIGLVVVPTVVVLALVVPGAYALSIPIYVLASALELLSTLTILIIMHIGMNLPWASG